MSPRKLEWMVPPDVGAEPRHQWWRRLRDVECSWVSSRGEAERFLYYDGPTLLKWPVRVTLKDDVLTFGGDLSAGADGAMLEDLRQAFPGKRISRSDGTGGAGSEREAWFVARDQNGVSAQWISQPGAGHARLTGRRQADGVDACATALTGWLTTHGLTESEARGLVECWRADFFGKSGMRLITMVNMTDYEKFCPVKIRPKPTQMVRVGLVVTELK